MEKALSFYETTIGKKILMALSGLGLFGFVIGHMAGNLQVFLGPEALNNYATKLHSLGPLLWLARGGLLAMLLVHVVFAMQLVARSGAARTTNYRSPHRGTTTFAALTMKWSGITLLLFLVYHLAHFTYPGVSMGAYETRPYTEVYTNVINGFSVPWVVGVYVLAMISLGMHLYHGAFSLFQTLGLTTPSRTETIKQGAQFVALTITLGNIAIPLAVIAGLVH